MKWNLKNRPRWKIQFPNGLTEEEQVVENWFEGFEKELREMLEERNFGEVTIYVIKEILGE